MILTIWLTLLALAVVVILLGYFTGDEPYLTVGLFFLFLLSIVILTGNLEYQTGETKATNYTYNNGTLLSQNEVTQFSYTPWVGDNSHQVGWGLAVVSFIGLALSLYNSRKRQVNSDE